MKEVVLALVAVLPADIRRRGVRLRVIGDAETAWGRGGHVQHPVWGRGYCRIRGVFRQPDRALFRGCNCLESVHQVHEKARVVQAEWFGWLVE